MRGSAADASVLSGGMVWEDMKKGDIDLLALRSELAEDEWVCYHVIDSMTGIGSLIELSQARKRLTLGQQNCRGGLACR